MPAIACGKLTIGGPRHTSEAAKLFNDANGNPLKTTSRSKPEEFKARSWQIAGTTSEAEMGKNRRNAMNALNKLNQDQQNWQHQYALKPHERGGFMNGLSYVAGETSGDLKNTPESLHHGRLPAMNYSFVDRVNDYVNRGLEWQEAQKKAEFDYLTSPMNYAAVIPGPAGILGKAGISIAKQSNRANNIINRATQATQKLGTKLSSHPMTQKANDVGTNLFSENAYHRIHQGAKSIAKNLNSNLLDHQVMQGTQNARDKLLSNEKISLTRNLGYPDNAIEKMILNGSINSVINKGIRYDPSSCSRQFGLPLNNWNY